MPLFYGYAAPAIGGVEPTSATPIVSYFFISLNGIG